MKRLPRIAPVERSRKPHARNTSITHLTSLIQTLYQQHKDEVWLLVRLHHRLKPSPRLSRKAGISPDEARQWSWLTSPDLNFDYTLQRLHRPNTHADVLHSHSLHEVIKERVALPSKDDTRAVTSGPRTEETMPTWFVLHLLYRKIRTPSDATRAWHLVLQHLPRATQSRHAPILLVAAHVLLSHGLFTLVRDLVDIFLALPLYQESFHLNVLLSVISHHAQNSENAGRVGRLCVRVLEALESRDMDLSEKTYRTLLSNRYITMQLTNALQARYLREGKVPDAHQLEAYARIYARHGRIYKASAYVQAVRAMLRRLDSPSSPHDDGQYPTAFLYLEALVRQRKTVAHPAVRRALNDDTETTSDSNGPSESHRPQHKSRTPAQWAARLHAISRDKRISSTALLRHFHSPDRLQPGFQWRKPLFYTMVIEGLLRRGDLTSIQDARKVWTEYRQTKLALDRPALIAGIRVLTRVGRVEEVLQLLEDAYQGARSDVRHKRLAKHRLLLESDGTVPASIMTRVMVGLVTYCARPDIVYYLWENMALLYGTKPDGETLTVFLIAAREASASFETVSGAIREMRREMRSWNPFRSSTGATDGTDGGYHASHPPESLNPSSLESARQDAYTGLLSLLHPSVRPTDTWDSLPAYRLARSVFRHILFTNHSELFSVQSPAHGIRKSRDDIGSSPLLELSRNFLAGRKDTFPPSGLWSGMYVAPPEVVVGSSKGISPMIGTAYPTIQPTERAFCAYILLLGSNNLASEIPLSLAWMRHLRIIPSKRTLALALVYWSEISLRAPLVESFSGQPGGIARLGVGAGSGRTSPYNVLVIWLEMWMGARRLPGDKEFGDALREVDGLRRRRGDRGR